MATRSMIAIENEDGSVTSIYCHFDGYPEHNGEILFEHYKDHEKVKKLIALGDISILAPTIEIPEGDGHTFGKPTKGIVLAYHRDRGEDFRQSKDKSVDEFFKGDIQEYGYCFTAAGEWLVKSAYNSFDGIKPLKEVLKKE
jgi:hypothetical protein